MNRPRRPSHPPPRKRPSGPPSTTPGTGGPPRRRTALDNLPTNVEPPFKVLGNGIDIRVISTAAQPMELAVIQLITREIEEAYQKSNSRYEDFWAKNPKTIDQLRRLDEVLVMVQSRRGN